MTDDVQGPLSDFADPGRRATPARYGTPLSGPHSATLDDLSDAFLAVRLLEADLTGVDATEVLNEVAARLVDRGVLTEDETEQGLTDEAYDKVGRWQRAALNGQGGR